MPQWVEFLLRILLAVGLGFVIGVERQLRLKVAGIRTHAIVAAGACMFMLISKYGFTDSGNFDASRVASQVVSGISFIGAGMIMHRQQAVHGLTSAAGIWLTAAIGMAAGAGMYIISTGATVIIIAVQLFMHIPCRLFNEKRYNEIKVVFTSEGDESHANVKKLFGVENFSEMSAERKGEEIIFTAYLHTLNPVDDAFICRALQENSNIKTIQLIESTNRI